MTQTITYAPACKNCGSTSFRVFEDFVWDAECDLETSNLDCTGPASHGISSIFCANCNEECQQAQFNQIDFS